ncbi:hypothetical protein KM759_gp116 [Lymphocystis disease virus 4]|uniref:Uncharacterized protein n=1 Tax=Lymphocystis disease virus 4 TaxID=2704413 RepID=A0A6B9XMM9_9VIRU|nr:hypothetical protein KM759_gp116 [Lymphocystis disease virus 4]QHR78563.1 hypothetical protein [Lymphocystis disease virus 4]
MISSAMKDREIVRSFAKREIHFEEPVCHINVESDNMGRFKIHPQPLTGCHKVGQFYQTVKQPMILRNGVKHRICRCPCKS